MKRVESVFEIIAEPNRRCNAPGICPAGEWQQTRKPGAQPHTLKQATHFGIFILKAVISGRGDELIDLAKINLFR
jgi:hypothetical protein